MLLIPMTRYLSARLSGHVGADDGVDSGNKYLFHQMPPCSPKDEGGRMKAETKGSRMPSCYILHPSAFPCARVGSISAAASTGQVQLEECDGVANGQKRNASSKSRLSSVLAGIVGGVGLRLFDASTLRECRHLTATSSAAMFLPLADVTEFVLTRWGEIPIVRPPFGKSTRLS